MNSVNYEYIAIFLLSLVCICFVFLAVKKRHDIIKFFANADIRNRIKQLILLVEKDLRTENGEARLWKVCSYIWTFIPPSLKPYITVEMLQTAVQVIFDLLAEKVDGHTVPIDKSIS